MLKVLMKLPLLSITAMEEDDLKREVKVRDYTLYIVRALENNYSLLSQQDPYSTIQFKLLFCYLF